MNVQLFNEQRLSAKSSCDQVIFSGELAKLPKCSYTRQISHFIYISLKAYGSPSDENVKVESLSDSEELCPTNFIKSG